MDDIVGNCKAVAEVAAESGLQALTAEQQALLPVRMLAREGVKTSDTMIADFDNFQRRAGVANKMDAADVRAMLADLVAEFPWLTLADFELVLRNALCGRYGEMYERLSQPKVFGWFRKHSEERADASERANYNQHLRLKNATPDIDVSEFYRKALMQSEIARQEEQAEMERARMLQKKAERLRDQLLKEEGLVR